jgi:hypothetical protein
MKMVKSLLLGSAAGLVAVVGAQAADLPVKAKPVEYVKICSVYGVGFYYIPGTDTCIKIGGFFRAEWNWNAGGSFNPAANLTAIGSADTRLESELVSRSRILTTWDVRTQTEFGTLRGYARAGWQWTTGDPLGAGSGAVTYIDRAFVQFAGFTFGLSQSFFEFYGFAQHSHQTQVIGADTGGTGINLIAYTAQFGNGFSATISIEDNFKRRKPLVDLNTAGFLLGTTGGGAGVVSANVTGDQSGVRYPDITANIRIDQAWGSAQLSGALHDLRANYFTGPIAGACAAPNLNTELCGHPGDEWGYAVNAGVLFNLPWAKGDTVALQAAWGKGAMGYLTGQGGLNLQRYSSNGNVALAWLVDGIFANPGFIAGYNGDIEQTEAFIVMGGIEHWWTPSLRTSLYGGYLEADYSNTANALFCASAVAVNGWGPLLTATCNLDFKFWQVGSRTVWNPVRNLDVGVDIIYSKINTEWNGTATLPAFNGRPAGTYLLGDEDMFSAIFRVQRNFWP